MPGVDTIVGLLEAAEKTEKAEEPVEEPAEEPVEEPVEEPDASSTDEAFDGVARGPVTRHQHKKQRSC